MSTVKPEPRLYSLSNTSPYGSLLAGAHCAHTGQQSVFWLRDANNRTLPVHECNQCTKEQRMKDGLHPFHNHEHGGRQFMQLSIIGLMHDIKKCIQSASNSVLSPVAMCASS